VTVKSVVTLYQLYTLCSIESYVSKIICDPERKVE